MKSTLKLVAAGGCLLAIGAGAVGVAAGDTAASPPSSVASQSVSQRMSIASAAAAETMPEAGVELVPDASGAGYVLQLGEPSGAIAQPASDDPAFAAPTPSDDQGLYAAAQASWRANLVAGLAASRIPDLTGVVVQPTSQAISSQAENFMHAVLRLQPGDAVGGGPKLGTVALATIQDQAQSNLAALASALPTGSVEQTRIVTVPVDRSANLYAIEVDVKVGAITDLQGNLGNVLRGLPTGLIGDANAVVEGLAINVVDNAGRRLGSWQTVRAQSGAGLWDSALSMPRVLAASTKFPNLTGGSDTLMSGQEAPAATQ